MNDLYIIPEDCVIINNSYVVYIGPEIQFALEIGFEEWGNLESTQSMNIIYNMLNLRSEDPVNKNLNTIVD